MSLSMKAGEVNITKLVKFSEIENKSSCNLLLSSLLFFVSNAEYKKNLSYFLLHQNVLIEVTEFNQQTLLSSSNNKKVLLLQSPDGRCQIFELCIQAVFLCFIITQKKKWNF